MPQQQKFQGSYPGATVTVYLSNPDPAVISAIGRAANVVTVMVPSGSGFIGGELVTIAGVADASFNGTFAISSATATSFSYAQVGANTSSSGGTAASALRLATLYADDNLTPKANPFTASTGDGTWFFYAANGHYDVKFSGGNLPAPFTVGDILLNDEVITGSGTPGKLAKFTSERVIGDSLVSDNGTTTVSIDTPGVSSSLQFRVAGEQTGAVFTSPIVASLVAYDAGNPKVSLNLYPDTTAAGFIGMALEISSVGQVFSVTETGLFAEKLTLVHGSLDPLAVWGIAGMVAESGLHVLGGTTPNEVDLHITADTATPVISFNGRRFGTAGFPGMLWRVAGTAAMSLSTTGYLGLGTAPLAQARRLHVSDAGTPARFESTLGALAIELHTSAGWRGAIRATATEVELGNDNLQFFQLTRDYNFGFGTNQYAGGRKVLALPNAVNLPSGSVTGGGVLFVAAGELKWLSSAGVVSDITPSAAASVAGSGTASALAKWVTSTTLGDASIADDGIDVFINPSTNILFATTGSVRLNNNNWAVNAATGNMNRIRAVDYTWPAAQGAADSFLKNDGAGNLTWEVGGVSGVTGSGTSSVVARFISPTVLGDSSIADDGLDVFLNPSTNVLFANTGTVRLNNNNWAVNATTGDITRIRAVSYAWPTSQGGTDTFLKNDGAGTLSWVSGATGLTGTGTPSVVARFVSASLLGDSSIADDGIDVFMNPSTNVLFEAATSVRLNNNAWAVHGTTGNIYRIRAVDYSWPASQGGANTFLRNDGSGNLTWVAGATGLTGSGTSSVVARFVSASVLGDSSIADDGIDVYLNPSTNVLFDAATSVRLNNNNWAIDGTSGDMTRIRAVTYSWPAAQGSSNTFLRNDGSGNLTWVTVSGGGGGGWQDDGGIVRLATTTDQVVLNGSTDPGSIGYKLILHDTGLSVTSTEGANSSVMSFAHDGSGGVMRIGSGRTGSGTVLAMQFTLGTANTERMRIHTNGNVGINDVAPAATLSVGGTIAASSTISAGIFSGNGSGISSLNASNLASGTVPSTVVSGTYSNAITLSNCSGLTMSSVNINVGDGFGIQNASGESWAFSNTGGLVGFSNGSECVRFNTAGSTLNIGGTYAAIAIDNTDLGNGVKKYLYQV